MATVTKYCKTITQTTGGKFATFENLNNIKNNTTGSYAESHTRIKGKSGSPNRPSTLTLTNFDFNLPSGALIKKIIVEYRHSKLKYNDKVCNIGAPTISLINVSGASGKGVAPTTSLQTNSKTFNVSPKASQVNSSNFGVKIDYPANTNSYEGYMRISYIRIKIEYVDSDYTLNIKKTIGEYNNDPYAIQVNLSNKNLTNNNPNVVITSPAGFTFNSSDGSGNLTQNNAHTFTWNPSLTSKKGTATLNITFDTDVVFPFGADSYTGTFTAVEKYKNTTANYAATITRKPAIIDEETEEVIEDLPADPESQIENPIHFIKQNELINCDLQLTDEELELGTSNYFHLQVYENPGYIIEDYDDLSDLDYLTFYDSSGGDHTHYVFSSQQFDERGNIKNFESIKFGNPYDETLPTEISIILYYYRSGYTPFIMRNIRIHLIPPALGVPFLTLLKPSDEEIDRLGNLHTYVAQTILKHTTDDVYERDWLKNNRIGVFNNAIQENITITEETDPETGEIIEVITDSTDYDNLTIDDIFEHAEYWSKALPIGNEYLNLECEFTHNKDYPLYILITGDYLESLNYNYDVGDVSFTEPCIVEQSFYNNREPSGIYPQPISNLIIEDGSNAELIIPPINDSSTLIFSNWELEEDYGTNDNLAVRGIGLISNIEKTDELSVYAVLKSPTGLTGERSLIIDSNENILSIGGLGDLWGLTINDFKELEDWEFQIRFSNLLNDSDSSVNFGDVQMVIFVEEITHQEIITEIEGINLGYYGVTVKSVEIPEGLETDTSYLTTDGTDTNDAYRQNIRQKYITLEMSVGSCDLELSTSNLRQLTKLLVNDRDQYTRPIPKRITFSHYPDVYWEYLLEKALDIDAQITNYIVKAQLTIPAGTSYSKEAIVTNTVGYVQGLAAVSPVIQIIPSSDTIEVLETVSNKKFNMGYSGDWYNKIVEINCEDMAVYLMDNEDDVDVLDISSAVDINSDWFRLHGEYNFSTTNCTFRKLTYNERW